MHRRWKPHHPQKTEAAKPQAYAPRGKFSVKRVGLSFLLPSFLRRLEVSCLECSIKILSLLSVLRKVMRLSNQHGEKNMKNTKNKSTRIRETKNKQKTHDIRLRNTQNNCPKMMKHRVVIYRERTANFKAKPLRVISIRVSEEDAEFLKSLPNASDVLRKAIDEERRNQRMLSEKGLPVEIVSEIAHAYVDSEIEWMEKGDFDLRTYTETLSSTLLDIAQLTLDCPDPFSKNKEVPFIPGSMSLDEFCEELQSKEAKAFIQRIKSKIEYGDPFGERRTKVTPLDADELETVRKIFDEAKELLQEGYRKTFHKHPPNDWHLTIIDNLHGEHVKLHYKLP
jgi:hypothetical protein